jgi:hypothetical protein
MSFFTQNAAIHSQIIIMTSSYKNFFDRSGQSRKNSDHNIGPRSFISAEGQDSGGGLFGNPESVGYHVVTPFIVDGFDGKAILVNRGWVPKRNINPASRPQGQVTPPMLKLIRGQFFICM